MLKRYQQVIGGLFRLVDACVIGFAWIASYWIRFYTPLLPAPKGIPSFEKYAALLPLIMILWLMVFSAMRLYGSKRMLRRTHEAQLLLKAHGVSLLIFISLTYLISEYRYSRAMIGYFAAIGGVLLIFLRLTLRNILRAARRRGFNLRHILAVGEGETITLLAQRLEKFPELGLRIAGVLTHSKSTAQEIGGKPVLGSYDSIRETLRTGRFDQVLIALPRERASDLEQVLALLKDETIDIRLVPDVHEYVILGCEVEDFEGLPIVNINGSPLDGWGAVAKRTTDVLLSGIALILLAPLLLLIALLVKITSRGPVFYSQERMGLDGRPFKMYKFRSMRVDAETQSGAVWAKENDPRRTRFGSLLRSTSLDELPQFWNVLKGDMSLVGPRPERPVFVSQFRGEIPNYMLRHKVKAGITGWAQVNGWRGNTSLERRIEFDLYYIRNWSYVFDWKILFLTLWKGLINKNAY